MHITLPRQTQCHSTHHITTADSVPQCTSHYHGRLSATVHITLPRQTLCHSAHHLTKANTVPHIAHHLTTAYCATVHITLPRHIVPQCTSPYHGILCHSAHHLTKADTVPHSSHHLTTTDTVQHSTLDWGMLTGWIICAVQKKNNKRMGWAGHLFIYLFIHSFIY